MTATIFSTPAEVVQAPQKPLYPAMVDTLQTHNQHARTTFTQASRVRRAEVVAERLAERKAKEEAESARKVAVSRSTEVSNAARVFEATAYIALCDTGCTGKTAMGHDVRNTIYYNGYRVIATDPDVIPMGTILRISYGGTSFKAIAWDTGGAIKGFKVDILVPTIREAKKFGRQRISVEVLGK